MNLQHRVTERWQHNALSFEGPKTVFMKQILTSIFLAACAATAHADWIKIDSPVKSANLYLDKSAAEKSGLNLIKLWHIVEYGATQQYEGKPFRSIKANYEYDCDNRRFREVIRILHSESMGNGMTVYWTHGLWSMAHDPSAWVQPAESSFEAALVTSACSK